MATKNNPPEKKVISVTGDPPEPDTKSWYEYQWKQRQETPQRLEEAARFLSGTISICLVLFLAIGKSRIEDIRSGSAALSIAVLLLLMALLVSFLVLFPWRYRFSGGSIHDFKCAHSRIILVKRVLLIFGLLLFLLSLSIMAYLFFH